MYLSVQENHKTIAKPLCFHTTLECPVNIMNTVGSTIVSGNSCLECSSLMSPWTLQFTLGPSIDIHSSCFSDNFTKDADKAMWRFVAFRNFESNILCRPVSCLEVHLLILQNLVHACSHHVISQNIKTYLLILAEHLSRKEQVHKWSSTDTWFYLV